MRINLSKTSFRKTRNLTFLILFNLFRIIKNNNFAERFKQ